MRDRRSIGLEARHVEALQQTLDRLRVEVEELRASRKRLVLAADAERRRIEIELHNGVQQHLVALAVNVQLAGRLADADPAAAKKLLEEMGGDVLQALDETTELSQRIYPQLLDAGGLVVALRTAAVRAGIPVSVSVEVEAGSSWPPEVSAAVYWCCLEVLEHAGAQATVTVREQEGALAFEVVQDGDRSDAGLERLSDRVQALGGRLTIASEPGRGTRVAGSLSLSR